jgi:hypothetical protein
MYQGQCERLQVSASRFRITNAIPGSRRAAEPIQIICASWLGWCRVDCTPGSIVGTCAIIIRLSGMLGVCAIGRLGAMNRLGKNGANEA